MIKNFGIAGFIILVAFVTITLIVQNTSRKLVSEIKQDRQETAKTHALIESLTLLESKTFDIEGKQEELKTVLGTKADMQARIKLLAEKYGATITVAFPAGSDIQAKSTKITLDITASSSTAVTKIASELETGSPRLITEKSNLRSASDQFTLRLESIFYQP